MQSETELQQTPLITPEYLLSDVRAALSHPPAWATFVVVIEAFGDLTHDIIFFRAGDIYPDTYCLPAISGAICFELTRYGNSVATNSNRDAAGARYLKFTWICSPKDNVPISRVIVAAGFHEAARFLKGRTDLRPENIQLVGAGKPTKDARELALKQAEAAARRYLADQPDNENILQAYLDNLRQLFTLHDAVGASGEIRDL